MSQKNELNLVSLYQIQEQEEMSESEMNVVFAGASCSCAIIDVYMDISVGGNQTGE